MTGMCIRVALGGDCGLVWVEFYPAARRVAKPVGYAGMKGAFTAVGVSRGCPQHFCEGGALGKM